jgi:hypothetical protein
LAALDVREREHLVELLERVHATMLAIDASSERPKAIQRREAR